MTLKEYARCCVNNKATLLGILGSLGWGALKSFEMKNNFETPLEGDYFLGLVNIALFYSTQFENSSYEVYKRVSKVLERGKMSVEEAREKIKPTAHCSKVGFKMALKDYERKHSLS